MEEYARDYKKDCSISCNTLGHETKIREQQTELEAQNTRYVAVASVSKATENMVVCYHLQWCTHVLNLMLVSQIRVQAGMSLTNPKL